jgi:hypothetical protein
MMMRKEDKEGCVNKNGKERKKTSRKIASLLVAQPAAEFESSQLRL